MEVIQTQFEPDDFALSEVFISWEKGEIEVIADLELKFKFRRKGDSIEVIAGEIKRPRIE